jgi:alpha-L-rhamnosidase
MPVTLERVTFEHYEPGQAVGIPSPRLSWRFSGSTKDWQQKSYDLRITRDGKTETLHVDSGESVLVPWPSAALRSREQATAEVSVTGVDGETTPWVSAKVEAALLGRDDWSAKVVTGAEQAADEAKTPILLRKHFSVPHDGSARLYITALGLYEAEINGRRVGDHVLSPGWQSYNYRHSFQTFDVSELLRPGENEITVTVGEGWYAGRLGWAGGKRSIYGSRIGALAQLEVDGTVVAQTDETWEWTTGPLITSELYDGEHVDTTKPSGKWSAVNVIDFPKGALISPQAPPMRRTQELPAVEIITTPAGKTVVDFGQNLVGWMRWNKQVDGSGTVIIRHAEVMEHGELGVRPLRVCKATDTLVLGGETKGHEPKFTFHGFRYAQIDGYPGKVHLDDFTAIVVHTDFERTGTFDSSHELVNKLYSNVCWGMRGNFLSVPTDCPQRDERLGWTGDLEAFAPTASFLYDVSGTLAEWLHDVAFEQLDFGKGVPPVVVPSIFADRAATFSPSFAIWGDVAAITPYDLFRAFGDDKFLSDQYESMTTWLDKGVRRATTGLWDPENFQLGDWLDPKAPPDSPAAGQTNTILTADAFLIHSTRVVARASEQLGKSEAAQRYSADAERLLDVFHREYVTPNSRLMSDSQCAYVLALWFDLAKNAKQASIWADRLETLVRAEGFKVGTGFAGTPLILGALEKHGKLPVAYRMLQEGKCPSWLYPVT